jgi:predicted HTH domain antitoxin
LAYAVDLFLRGIVSVERAAELAEMQLYDFLLELRKRGYMHTLIAMRSS